MESKPIFLNAPQTVSPADGTDAGILGATGLPDNPFVGLRPFESTEELLFFGRRTQTKELLNILHASRFVAVVGSSGCGKSSLIRAGLIPNLEAGFIAGAVDRWDVATMKPGNSPLRNFAAALLSAVHEEPDSSSVEQFVEDIRLRGMNAVIIFLQSRTHGSDANLLLLVDQFEEIFRFGSYDDENEKGESESRDEQDNKEKRRSEATDFVSIMLGLSYQESFPVYVVMTMRSDFLGDCDAFYGLPEAMNRSQYLVPRLTRQQRQESIENPIRLYGAAIAPRLTDRVLNDMVDELDPLPITQHAMMRTWERWQRDQNGPLDLSHYEGVGAIKEALSRDAEQALSGMSKDEVTIAARMFQALTATDAKGRRLRRPAFLSEIVKITDADRDPVLSIIERFRAHSRSFLTLSEDPRTGDPLVDISHESLIRRWATLRGWVDDEVKSRELYLRLAGDAVRHEQKEAPLWSDPALQLALNWWEKRQPNEAWGRRYHSEFALAKQFLKQSEQKRAEDQERAERQTRLELERARALAEQRRIYNRRLRLAVLALAVLLVLAAGTAVFALEARASARRSENMANAAKVQIEKQKDELKIQQDNLRIAFDKLTQEKIVSDKATRDALTASAEAEKQAERAKREKKAADVVRSQAQIAQAADAENWLATKAVKASSREPDPKRKGDMLNEALKSYNTSINKYTQLKELDIAASVHAEAGQAILDSADTDSEDSAEIVDDSETPLQKDWVSSQLLKMDVPAAKRFAGLGLSNKQKEGLDHLGHAINIYRQVAHTSDGKGGSATSEAYNNSATAFQDVAEFLSPPQKTDSAGNVLVEESDTPHTQAAIYSFCAALEDYGNAGNLAGQVAVLKSIGDRLSADTSGDSEEPNQTSTPTLAGCSGQPADAIVYYEQTIPVYRKIVEESAKYPEQAKTRRDEEIDMLLKIAGIYHDRKDDSRARRKVDDAAAVDLEGTADKLKTLGFMESQPAKASWYYLLAVQEYHDAGKTKEEADTLAIIGRQYAMVAVRKPDDLRPKEYEKAFEFFQKALALYETLGDNAERANICVSIGSAYYTMNKPEESVAAYQKALEFAKAAGNKKWQGRALYGIGRYQAKQGLKQQAIESLTLAQQFSREGHDPVYERNARMMLLSLRGTPSATPSPNPIPSASPTPVAGPGKVRLEVANPEFSDWLKLRSENVRLIMTVLLS